MTETKRINLFQKTPLEKQAPKKKFLGWLSSFGKAIIIATNVVTIGAFVMRVKMDQDKIDLREKIAAQERVVKASQSFESEFRSFQEKVTTLSSLSQKTSLAPYMDFIEKNIPAEITLRSAAFEANGFDLSLSSQSSLALSVMVAKMLESGAQEIILSGARVEKDSGLYQFEIQVKT